MNVVRFGGVTNTSFVNHTRPACHPSQTREAIVLFTFSGMGMLANVMLMLLIVARRPLRRWSHGLLFHQGFVDCLRASLLVPLAYNVFYCQKLPKCSYVETAFLLMVTVSTVNLLTSVINDAPLLLPPEAGAECHQPEMVDSRQCICFGLSIIWFSSLTINLGPTFLSGTLWNVRDPDACPMVYGSVRHYVLNVLWVLVNVFCIVLTGVHLRKLHRDLTKSNLEALRIAGFVTTMLAGAGGKKSEEGADRGGHIQAYIHQVEEEGLRRVRMFGFILIAYLMFWGPLFAAMMVYPSSDDRASPSLAYELAMHFAFIHAFVNPVLLLFLHRDLKRATKSLCCCRRRDVAEPEPPDHLCRPYMETTL